MLAFDINHRRIGIQPFAPLSLKQINFELKCA